MTALEVPGFGGLYPSARRTQAAITGSWTLADEDAEFGSVELLARRRGPRLPFARPVVQRLALVSGAITVESPLDHTVGEITIAVGTTGTARLTICDLTALGNRRYAVDLVFSHCGPVAGPDEKLRLEGGVARGWDDVLRVTLSGAAPTTLGGGSVRFRLRATFTR
jgi:hypothetical protein